MSASQHSSTKIAKIRTFAQDAEKHANQSIDDVRATHASATNAKSDSTKEQPPYKSKEVVDLDVVDTTETTEVEETTKPIPKKNHADNDTDTATEDTAAGATDKDDKDISNPPFHKLEAERKKAAEKISSSSETISNHPESLLSGEKKQTFSVDDNEATAGATIVTDTKTSRKGVWADIGDSVTGWFSDIKNTYITPPKPSYTVSKSERRAGILQDATGKTGTDLVDHDSFAARIRERYQSATQESSATTTEPAWLPSLPAGKKSAVSDVKTVSRKSVQTPDSDQTNSKETHGYKTAAEKQATAAPENPTVSQPKSEAAAPASHATLATPHTTAENTNQPPATKNEAPKKPLSQKATEATASDSAPEPTTNAVPKTTAPKADISLDDIDEVPTKSTPVASAESKAAATQQPPAPKPTKEPGTPPPKVAANPPTLKPEEQAPQEPQPATERKAEPDADEASAAATEPTAPEPTKAQLATDEYVLPSDDELDVEAVWNARQATNRLTIGVVLGTTVAVVAGLVVYSIAPLFMNETDNTTVVIAAPFGNNMSELAARDWNDSLPRTQAVREAMDAEISNLQYIALTDANGPITDPGRFAELLTIEMPVAVQTTGQALYAGNYRGTPFLYLHAPDTPQIFGAFLAWETSMTSDLESLLPITDHSGTFVDMVIDDTYDARVRQSNANASTLTYTIVGDYVLITTTPEEAEAILSAL